MKKNFFFGILFFAFLTVTLSFVLAVIEKKQEPRKQASEGEMIQPLVQATGGYPKIHMPSGGMALPSATYLREAVNYDLIEISADTLARQDLYNILKETKRQNPNLVVLLYIASQEAPPWSPSSSPLYGQVYVDARANGWIRFGADNWAGCSTGGDCGTTHACWGNNPCIDISSGWKDYVPNKMNEWITQNDPDHLVNGVYYDNAKKDPFCCPQNVSLWRESMKTIFDHTNGTVGGNDIYYPIDNPYLGHMDFSSREMWPGISSPCGYSISWNNNMRVFYGWVSGGGSFGLAHDPSGKTATDYATMRLGLTTSLLADRGYYHYWPGVRGGILVYDEYAVNLTTGQATRTSANKGYLGQPVGQAHDPISRETFDTVYRRNLTTCTDNTEADLSRHVWVREYQNGVVITNPSSSAKTILKSQLPAQGNLKRILGTQAPSVNNGQPIGDSITIPAGDGIILLKMSLSPTPTSGQPTPTRPPSTPTPTRPPVTPTPTGSPAPSVCSTIFGYIKTPEGVGIGGGQVNLTKSGNLGCWGGVCASVTSRASDGYWSANCSGPVTCLRAIETTNPPSYQDSSVDPTGPSGSEALNINTIVLKNPSATNCGPFTFYDVLASPTTPTPTRSQVTPTPTTIPTSTPTRSPATPTPTSPPLACTCSGSSLEKRRHGDYNCRDGINLIDYNIWIDKFIRGTAPTEDLSCENGPGTDDFNVWANNYQSPF